MGCSYRFKAGGEDKADDIVMDSQTEGGQFTGKKRSN